MSKNTLRKIGFTIISVLSLLSIKSMLDGNLINAFLFMLMGVGTMGVMDRYKLL